ncbi:MAG: Bax inhibitor-1/YccA family protein [Thermoguttaceae bacterium]|jgi:uncharacterized YccA/Bax inhibitor family protein
MQTANPVLSNKTFDTFLDFANRENTMTVGGTVNKTGVLLACVLASAAWTWGRFSTANPAEAMPYLVGGGIAGFVLALITTFKMSWAPFTAPLYALAEGLVLGGLSAMIESQYPGIAVQAVAMTFGTLACMLLAYRAGMIRATQRFKLGVIAATGAIFLVYMVSWLLSLFGVHAFALLNSNGLIGIGVSVLIVGIAALNLILDFDLIESGSQRGAPKYMEWYGAFALMVTLIWLYIEILRLLSKLRSRN